MKTISPLSLSTRADVTIDRLFVMRQHWEVGQVFFMDAPRKQSAFLWFVGGSGEFLSPDGTRHCAARGDLVYIPEGSRYTLRFSDCTGELTTLLLELCLAADGEGTVLYDGITTLAKDLSDRRVTELLFLLADEFERPERSYFSLRSRYFTLLSLLAENETLHGIRRRGAACIEKGIRYLQTDGEQALSLDEVAALCPVSPAYFRRVFRACFGVSPSAYRTARRIGRAKEMLAHTALGVEEISERLGFESPSYFCRAFKREVGLSPSAYRKTLLS